MTAFEPEQFKGKLSADLIDAETGKIKVPAGERMTPRLAKRLREEGLMHVLAPHEELVGRYFGRT